MSVRSRIAPTPSGFLHLGNAVNFILTWLLVRRAGGSLKLRIDDADCARTQPEFIEDIFVQLQWLGLDWDEGPGGPADFGRSHSQLLRLARYRALLAALRDCAVVFPCACSRKEIRARAASGLYPGTCRHRRQAPAGEHAVRMLVPEGTFVAVGDSVIALCREMGDFVLWRRDDLPAYQLASLADDLDDGINLIVRGEDLRTSTAAQLYLAERLGAQAFQSVDFHHHPLLISAEGLKLSKSDNALSLAAMRRQGARPRDVYQAASRLLGLDPGRVRTLADLRGLLEERAEAENVNPLPEGGWCYCRARQEVS
ncbi:glutamate--tRNA ligase family protein [Thiovibrio sp. JS02]